MKRNQACKFISSLLLLLLINVMFSKLVFADTPQITVFFKGGFDGDEQLNTILDDYREIEWVIITDDIQDYDLIRSVMMIIVMEDPSFEFTEDDLDSIREWFEVGGKTIWVAGDSDYGVSFSRQISVNHLLTYIESSLRIESCSVNDNKSNSGLPYRVFALPDKCDVKYRFLVNGVDQVLMHGPGAVVYYDNGSYNRLEDLSTEDLYTLLTTSTHGFISDYNPPEPEVHHINETGSIVVMSIEKDETKGNMILVSGDAPFSHDFGMYKPEILDQQRYQVEHQQQGETLFKNIIDYVLNNPPIVKINGPYTSHVGQEVNFTSLGTSDPEDNIVEYIWGFGDETSTEDTPNPTHIFTKAGIYTISLTVRDEYGETVVETTTCTISENIQVNTDPIAQVNGPYIGEVGEEISFKSTGSTDPDGSITDYRWNFGDGSNYSDEINPTHAYTEQGTYTVSLRVTDEEGATNLDVTTCTVSPAKTSTGGTVSWPLDVFSARALISVIGACVGLGAWMLNTLRKRRTKKILFSMRLDNIEDIYSRYRMNARECESELLKLNDNILSEFKEGVLGENNYSILEKRIRDYLTEIREDLNTKN